MGVDVFYPENKCGRSEDLKLIVYLLVYTDKTLHCIIFAFKLLYCKTAHCIDRKAHLVSKRKSFGSFCLFKIVASPEYAVNTYLSVRIRNHGQRSIGIRAFAHTVTAYGRYGICDRVCDLLCTGLHIHFFSG